MPVLFADGSSDHVPMPVKGATIQRPDLPEGYDALYRLLTDQPAVRKPELGTLRRLPELPRQWAGEPPLQTEQQTRKGETKGASATPIPNRAGATEPSPESPFISDDSSTPALDPNIDAFVKHLARADIARFYVIAITGRATIPVFLNALEHTPLLDTPIECRLLLRSPSSTDKRRADTYTRTRDDLNHFQSRHPNFKTETRTYSSTSPLHCIIAEHSNRKYSAYMAFYDWTRFNSREGTSDYRLTRYDQDRGNQPLRTYLSWFDHFWGRRKIHTLLFDFDDTLFLTTYPQVKGWTEAINWALETRIIVHADLREDIRRPFSNGEDPVPIMTDIFLDEQIEENIFKRVLEKGVSERTRQLLRERRTAVREELTELEAVPISGILQDLKRLESNYQLVIVSATSESLISRVLVKNGVNAFSFILGREVKSQKWEFVERKAQHFIRISNMLGVPLERMIFIGDSHADYRAAAQLGLHFIENRYNAERHSRKSLIQDVEADYYLSKNLPGELLSKVEIIEAKLKM